MGTKHLDATISWTMLRLFRFSIGKIDSVPFFLSMIRKDGGYEQGYNTV
jgi:hypothetical protein